MPPVQVTSDGQVLSGISGTKNYHAALTQLSGMYITWFVPANQGIESLSDWNALPAELLANLGTCVLFMPDRFTVSGGVYTYNGPGFVPSSGVNLHTGLTDPPALTATEGGYAATVTYYDFGGHAYDATGTSGIGPFFLDEQSDGGGGGGGGGGGDPSAYFAELGSILYELANERDLGLSGSSSVDNFTAHRGWFVPEITKKLLLAAWNALTGLTVALGEDGARDELARQANASYHNQASPIPGQNRVLPEPEFRGLYISILQQLVADLVTIGADESVIASITSMVEKLESGKTSLSPVIKGDVQRTVISDRSFREQVVSILSSWLSAISP